MKKLFALMFLLTLALGSALRAQELDGLDEMRLIATFEQAGEYTMGFKFSGTPGEKFIIRWSNEEQWMDYDTDTIFVGTADELEISRTFIKENSTSLCYYVDIFAINPTGHILSLNVDSVYKYTNFFLKCPELTTLYVAHNNLEVLTAICPALEILDCSYNRLISTFNNSNQEMKALTYVNCSHNPSITYVEGESYPSLQTLDCSYCGLQYQLDLRVCKALVSLHCENNHLRELILDKISTLQEVYCQNNQLIGLALDSTKALRRLNCSNNQFDRLEFIDYPSLDSLDISNNILLKELTIRHMKLKFLDLSVAPNLENVYCRENDSLMILKVDNPVLQVLYGDHNRLESLLIDNCTALKTLFCACNQLASLKLPSDVLLERLVCDSNGLTLSNLADLVNSSLYVSISPQLITVLRQVGQTLDLRSELNINNEETKWNILDADGNVITDYTNTNWGGYRNGCFLFPKTGWYRIALHHDALPRHDGDLIPADVFYDITVVDSVARPVFSEPSGAVKRHTSVSLSTTTPDARIYYTTDGSAPDSTALLYTAPLYIDEAVAIKAIAIQDTFASQVATASYTIAMTPDTTITTPDTTIDNEQSVLAAQTRIYVKDKVIYVPENIGAVEVFTANGQCVYKGSATAIPVRRSGLYVVVAKGGRWKVAVR